MVGISAICGFKQVFQLIAGRSANVRVATYRSRMAVRAHTEFDERGMGELL